MKKKKTTCLCCETRFSGNYCPRCGQKATVGRLSRFTLFDDLFYSFTSMDRGFLFTIRELFTRPGHMMRDYLAGRRSCYYRPFAMLTVLAGVYLLLSLLLLPEEVADPQAVTVSTSAGGISDRLPSWVVTLIDVLFRHPVTASLLLIFTAARVTPWVFRKEGGRRYNYVEYLFVGVYMASQRFVIDIVLLPYELIPESAGWPDHTLCIGLAYVALTAWNYKQFFGMRWWRAIRKTIGLMLLAFLIIVALVIIVLALLVGGSAWLHF